MQSCGKRVANIPETQSCSLAGILISSSHDSGVGFRVRKRHLRWAAGHWTRRATRRFQKARWKPSDAAFRSFAQPPRRLHVQSTGERGTQPSHQAGWGRRGRRSVVEGGISYIAGGTNARAHSMGSTRGYGNGGEAKSPVPVAKRREATTTTGDDDDAAASVGKL
jgi:hypothetical protein